VELFYRRGWSVEEIAGTLECPANTVKTLLSRARERLRGLLNKEAPDEPAKRIRMEVLL
jgi:DNA-directed RNA polymerase specialized sigma24 family protein